MKQNLIFLAFALLFTNYTISVTVTNFNDTILSGSLRAAINEVNAGATDTIIFENDSEDTIQLNQGEGLLPEITKQVTINGTNLATGNNVTIDGANLNLIGVAWGFKFTGPSATGSEIRNLIVTNFSTDAFLDGILADQVNEMIVDNMTIGDFTANGTCTGIRIEGDDSQISNNTVNGTITQTGNNDCMGIAINGENSRVNGNAISGNIGSGSVDTSKGIVINGGNTNEVSDNTVSASMEATDFVAAIATSRNDTKILRNNITLDFVQNATVTSSTGTKAGVLITGDGTVPSTQGIRNLISQNSIYGNLDVPGILLVDQGNANQAAPIINEIIVCNQGVRIEGSLSTELNSEYKIELFSNGQRGQPNQGINYLGFITVDGNGDGSTNPIQFSEQFTSTHIFTDNEYFTVTATNVNNNTSQFSDSFNGLNIITPEANNFAFPVCSSETYNNQLTGSNTGASSKFELVAGSGPNKGVLNLNLDGSFSYTPDENASGSDRFEFIITNGTCISEPAAVVNIAIIECDAASLSIEASKLSDNRVIITGEAENLDDHDVFLYQNGELIQTEHINSPFSFIVGPLEPGEYEYQVKAFDNYNEISSNIVYVLIIIPPIPPRPPSGRISLISRAIRNKYCPLISLLVSPNAVSLNGFF